MQAEGGPGDAPRPVAPSPDVSVGGGIGTPGSAVVQPTGDRQLDRVQQIDIDAIRDQRVGGAASGIADPSGGPAQFNQTAPPVPGQPAAPAPVVGANGQPEGVPKEKPVYKKWWFWAVVAVSAYVVYSIATEDSRAEPGNGRTVLPPIGATPAGGGGATLLRF